MRFPRPPVANRFRIGLSLSVTQHAAHVCTHFGYARKESYHEHVKTIHTTGYRALLAWLREQRRARGLSMRDLANRLEIAHSWIGKIETGERRLDISEYIRLCAALECDYREGIQRLLDAERT